MFVAASTRCFPDLTFRNSLQALAELDFRSAEIVIGGMKSDIPLSWLVTNDILEAGKVCLLQRQITPVALFLDVSPSDPKFYTYFENSVRFCQMIKVVTLVIRASSLGVPYNEEHERLSRLTKFALGYGVVVSLLTESGRVSGGIDSLQCLCKGIPELTITLDPSHFIFGQSKPIDFSAIIPFVSHVRLRDTTRKDFQVQVGQGELEYSKLVGLLAKVQYRRALCIEMRPLDNSLIESELRKMRLLVESNI